MDGRINLSEGTNHGASAAYSCLDGFKLKGDAAAPPDVCLGVTLEMKTNSQGTKCWTMSPEKHVDASVKNVEEKLAKDGLRLPNKCPTPMVGDYHPSDDVSAELHGFEVVVSGWREP